MEGEKSLQSRIIDEMFEVVLEKNYDGRDKTGTSPKTSRDAQA